MLEQRKSVIVNGGQKSVITVADMFEEFSLNYLRRINDDISKGNFAQMSDEDKFRIAIRSTTHDLLSSFPYLKTENPITRKNAEERILEVVNKMIELCEPISYKDMNVVIPAKDSEKLFRYGAETKEVVLADAGEAKNGISTLSIIASITELLTGKRLGFVFDNDDMLIGVAWYRPTLGENLFGE